MRQVALCNALVALALLACADGASATSTTGRLLVSLDRPAAGQAHSAAALTAVAARAGARPDASRSVPQIGLLTVRPRPGESLHQLAVRLRATPGVRAVQAEGRATLRALPNDPALVTEDPSFGTPPGTVEEWWAARENLPALWDRVIAAGVAAPLVAVIDSGIDGTHPELQARVRKTHDQDATPGHAGPLVDEVGHGTHVASLACATANDGVSIVGAGLSCNLDVIKSDFADASVAKGIVTAADDGAVALNMSFGTDDRVQAPQAIVDAIDYAYKKNVVMVGAGSDLAEGGKPVTEQGDPSNVLQPRGTGPQIASGKGLSVTAAQFDGTRAPFAGSGSEISLATFGTFSSSVLGPIGILGAWPAAETDIDRGDPTTTPAVRPCGCRTTIDGDNRYAYLNGTSMAAPQATATAALLRALNPDLTAGEIVRVLKQTAARPTGAWTPDLGWGILDAGAAGAAVAQMDGRAPVSRASAPATSESPVVTVRLTSADDGPRGVLHSGVASVALYGGNTLKGARRLGIEPASTTSVRVRLDRGANFVFYTRAIDRAGNREATPAKPDARTRVAR